LKSYALLDSDIIAFQCALRCQETIKGFQDEDIVELIHDEEFLYTSIKLFIKWVLEVTKTDTPIVCLSDPEHNFRHDVLPTYKGNRIGVDKPLFHSKAREYLELNYKTYLRPSLEADDVMGILSTHPKFLKGRKVVCTVDKDLYQIPGLIFNWNKVERGVEEVTQDVGEMFHMVQTLTGDVCDGYEGILGIGEAKAYKLILEGLQDDIPMWQTVIDVYEDNGCTEEDALCIARVARMCTASDYDYTKKGVILWNPPKI